MRRMEPGQPPRPRPDYAQLLDRFPGPVVIACDPPTGSKPLPGGEDADGQPWSIRVLYAGPGAEKLLVRTVRSDPDRSPHSVTVGDLGNAMAGFGYQVGADTPRVATSVPIDDVPVAGVRVDLPGCAGVQLDWQGQTVFCVGKPKIIDSLRLRSASNRDFAGFVERLSFPR
jgi:hypothetical protein